MELSIVQIVLRLMFLAAGLILGTLFFVYFIGMHNNTVDGNSFRLLNPLSFFDKSQFNEEGNRCRIKFLKVWLVGLLLLPITQIALSNGY